MNVYKPLRHLLCYHALPSLAYNFPLFSTNNFSPPTFSQQFLKCK
uniref:Uncharacterized protein n=1 Tax=Meloidogyne enterolobii TaxID=390850 RepID=A0A6V7UJH6_MELEN|nr:unnamed protein product [Meloidogyne enterolobii]